MQSHCLASSLPQLSMALCRRGSLRSLCRAKHPLSVLRKLDARPRRHQYHSTTSAASAANDMERQRRELLDNIYAPFRRLGTNSEQYWKLARSGDCWYNHFDPENIEEYQRLEKVFAAELRAINMSLRSRSIKFEKQLKLSTLYAHQSCAIEANLLSVASAVQISNKLISNSVFSQKNLKQLSAAELQPLQALPPSITELSELIDAPSPSSEEVSSQVAELRNHIVASHWITSTATVSETSGVSEPEIKLLNAFLLKDTLSEKLYAASWGPRTSLGDYRQLPIRVRSKPLQVFPYHAEVPAVMQRYIRWRDLVHTKKVLHPLIFACKSFLFFESVHPFLDGNGRVGRVIMQDYLIRQGYLPPYMETWTRKGYIDAVKVASEGKPGDFVEMMLRGESDSMELAKGDLL